MGTFAPSEVFQFAIRIEENGERFYRQMAQKLDDPEIKELFMMLVDEEIIHKRTFENMVSKIESYEPVENFPGEYFAYLRAYADHVIFNEKQLNEIIASIDDKNSALDFAIRNEVASISYYLDVKKLVPEKQRSKIDKIIDEERRHFIKLSDMKS
jgi:rubrerythrin